MCNQGSILRDLPSEDERTHGGREAECDKECVAGGLALDLLRLNLKFLKLQGAISPVVNSVLVNLVPRGRTKQGGLKTKRGVEPASNRPSRPPLNAGMLTVLRYLQVTPPSVHGEFFLLWEEIRPRMTVRPDPRGLPRRD